MRRLILFAIAATVAVVLNGVREPDLAEVSVYV
jgi:hypothetical protein